MDADDENQQQDEGSGNVAAREARDAALGNCFHMFMELASHLRRTRRRMWNLSNEKNARPKNFPPWKGLFDEGGAFTDSAAKASGSASSGAASSEGADALQTHRSAKIVCYHHVREVVHGEPRGERR